MRSVLRTLTIVATALLAAGCSKQPPQLAGAPGPAVGSSPAPVDAKPAPGDVKAAPGDTKPVVKGQALTEKTIKNCLEAAKDPKIQEVMAKYKTASKDGPAGLQAGLAGLGADKELEGIVKQHGFDNWADWAATTSKLFIGAYKLNMDKAMANQKDVPPDAAKAMAKAHGDMMENMAQAEKSVGGITADELKAIEKMLPEIQKLGKQG